MLRVDEARKRIVALAESLPSEVLPLVRARGRVLAEDIVAPSDLPTADLSMMDGYAVCASEAPAEGSWTLPIAGESRAGRLPPRLTKGTAMRIFTGAALPEGADAVVMQEDTCRNGDELIVRVRVARGAHRRPRGEDMRRGEVVLPRGSVLSAARVALAAQCDRATLSVARSPRIAILSTGDELRAPGSPPREGTIAEAASSLLRGPIDRSGGVVVHEAIVRDDLLETVRSLEEARSVSDVVVTIGGVSVGEHDLVRPALEKLGAPLDFWKVAMRPGKPLAVAKRGASVFLGLPGNPVSAAVTFALFGAPLLLAMQGADEVSPATVLLPLASAYPHSPGRAEFPRAFVVREAGRDSLVPVSRQASGSVRGLAESHGVFFVPEDSTGIAAGSMVEFLRLE